MVWNGAYINSEIVHDDMDRQYMTEDLINCFFKFEVMLRRTYEPIMCMFWARTIMMSNTVLKWYIICRLQIVWMCALINNPTLASSRCYKLELFAIEEMTDFKVSQNTKI